MENLIKKIEQYQIDHKVIYDAAMEKKYEHIVFDFAAIIGRYQSQLEIIKNELKNK